MNSRKVNKQGGAPGNNFQESLPGNRVPEGDHVVKKPEDKTYKRKESTSKYPKPAAYKESSEQPVHPIKNPPNEQQ